MVLPGGSLNLNTLSLTHTAPSQGFARCSLASVGDEVFVACKSRQQIEMYDAGTFMLLRRITVPGLGSVVHGLAVDVGNDCLYASDYQNDSVHRVKLSDTDAVEKWSVGSNPSGLSVNKEHNLVVACRGSNKLQEYTTRGILVREISLESKVVSAPWHAVQLSTGDYVVSQSTSLGLITVVGLDGQQVCRYDRLQTPEVRSMEYPRSLAVTDNDDILVADDIHNRILLLNSSLSSAQVLTLQPEGGINRPWGLCLDESRGRLYVSEYTSGRVLVFEGECQ